MINYYTKFPHLYNLFYNPYLCIYKQPIYYSQTNSYPIYPSHTHRTHMLPINRKSRYTRVVNLNEIEKKTNDVIKETINNKKQLINNTLFDIESILKPTENCIKRIDDIRVQLSSRVIEYENIMFRQLIDNKVLPVELIKKVRTQIRSQLEKNPNPRIFKLINPKESVWNGKAEKLQEVDVNVPLPQDHTPYVFIHGTQYRASKSEAFEFYRQFELVAKMFNNPYVDYSKTDIYLVSYDSNLTDEEVLIIRKGFSDVLSSQVSGDSSQLYIAVLWEELERRARFTADNKILPFLKQISLSNNKGRVITHSLGCYALAHAGYQFIKKYPSMKPPFLSWFCMAPTLPENAFAYTGIFSEASKIAGIPKGIDKGTSIWFSNFDFILTSIYVLTENRLPMGQRGAVALPYSYTNIDVTKCVKDIHMTKEHEIGGILTPGYFTLLGPTIRKILHTEVASEIPSCYIEISTPLY